MLPKSVSDGLVTFMLYLGVIAFFTLLAIGFLAWVYYNKELGYRKFGLTSLIIALFLCVPIFMDQKWEGFLYLAALIFFLTGVIFLLEGYALQKKSLVPFGYILIFVSLVPVSIQVSGLIEYEISQRRDVEKFNREVIEGMVFKGELTFQKENSDSTDLKFLKPHVTLFVLIEGNDPRLVASQSFIKLLVDESSWSVLSVYSCEQLVQENKYVLLTVKARNMDNSDWELIELMDVKEIEGRMPFSCMEQ